MTQFKVYASKDNEGQIIGATVVAYDGADRRIEKITVLDEQDVSALNRRLEEVNSTLSSRIKSVEDGKSDKGHDHDSSYYSKAYIDDLEDSIMESIAGIVSFDTVVVDVLPSTGVVGTFYFVPKDSGDELNNVYEEYVWVEGDSSFELVGSTEVTVDLSNYYTRSEVDALVEGSIGGEYYTKTETDTKLAEKSDTGHNHDSRYYTESEVNTKLAGKAGTSLASSTANGLMSSTDKGKLDGVATGANKTVVDSSMSSSSTNPVQNKIVYQELSNKANTSHTHTSLDYITIPSNADLNDYKAVGLYNCTYSFSSIRNKPTNWAFYLEVHETEEGTTIKQIFHGVGETSTRIYERNYYVGTGKWTQWFEYYTTYNYNPSDYYKKTETDNLLSGKASSSHNHDSRYYTESEMNTKLASKSDTSHGHTRLNWEKIPNYADLNDYTTEGVYRCTLSSTADTVQNAPHNWAFRLEVLETTEGNGAIQIFYSYHPNIVRVWQRNMYDGTWSEWYEYTLTPIGGGVNSIFYDSLTANNGGWTIPAEVQSASSYSAGGWRITSSNGYKQIKNNTVIPSENIEVSFNYIDGDTSGRVMNILMVFYNGTTNTGVGLLYSPYDNTLEVYQGGGKKTKHALESGDKLTYKYNNGQATIQVNNETILTHTYNGKTLTGTHLEFHTHTDRWLQIKDFTIKNMEG